MNPTEDQKQGVPPVERELNVLFPSKRMRFRSERKMKRRRRRRKKTRPARTSPNLAHLLQSLKWSVSLSFSIGIVTCRMREETRRIPISTALMTCAL